MSQRVPSCFPGKPILNRSGQGTLLLVAALKKTSSMLNSKENFRILAVVELLLEVVLASCQPPLAYCCYHQAVLVLERVEVLG